jgi:hypothetical protein
MASSCSVCDHTKIIAIDRDIISGVPVRKVAEKYSLGSSAVGRHRKKCITMSIATVDKKKANATVKNKTLSGESILGNMKKLTDSLEELKHQAAEDGQFSASISAVKEQIRMGENLLKRAEDLILHEQSQNKDTTDYKENLPDEVNHFMDTVLNDPELSDEVEAEYEIVS